MAKTYTLIQAQTLTATTASVTFSNIPQNYTDLIVKISGRATAGTGTSRAIQLQINGDTTYANYRQRYLRTDDTGAAQAGAFLSSTGLRYYFYGLPNANVTANSFGAAELTFINYAGSSYKTFSVEAFAEGFHNPFTGTAGNSITAALWVNTSPITTLVFNPDDSSFAAGSTFYLYGIGGARATGGTITSDQNYTYHTFTSTSTFTPLEKIKNAEILMVAGGGGGGGTEVGGGGGGAGGVLYTAGTTLFAGTSYTALVGAGGAGATTSSYVGTQGANSTFISLAAIGGGYGSTNTGNLNGGSGGSGGGAGSNGSTGTGGTATAGQGNAGGGNNIGGGGSDGSAAGGGGAGAVGFNAYPGSYSYGADGGVGTTRYTDWHSATSTGVLSNGIYYIAGGAGGGAYRGAGGYGGLGGGGNGGQSTSNAGLTAGTANTGGGGGGGASQGAARVGAAGGSGLIIVRYPSI